MKERNIAYDYIRIAAMILVVACHSFGDTTDVSSSVISLLSYIEMPCNGLFFAVSGALLLPVKTTPEQSLSFLTKRLKKVVAPTMVWTVVYLLLKSELPSPTTILSIPFSQQGAPILWFMYTMVGLYILAPVISPWLERTGKKTLEVYLAFWAITLCYPIFENWLSVNETYTGVLYYFSGFVGYFILGFYLKKYGIKMGLSTIIYFLAFAIMLSIKLFANHICLYHGFWNLTIFCATGVVFYWNIMEYLSKRIQLAADAKRIISTMSNLIFGVYFIHYGIIKYLIPHLGWISGLPYLVGYAITTLIAFIGALLMSFLISYLPFANLLIGYKRAVSNKK